MGELPWHTGMPMTPEARSRGVFCTSRGASELPLSGGEVLNKGCKSHKVVNRHILEAAESGNATELLKVIQRNLPHMNLVNVSTALHRAAKRSLIGTPEERALLSQGPIMQNLCNTAAQLVGRVNPSRACAAAAEDAASEMRCLSIICWSCGTLERCEEFIFSHTALCMHARMSELKPFELSNLLWAFAKLAIADSALFEAVIPHLMHRRAGRFIPQCLWTILWAYGTVKVYDYNLFNSIAQELVRHPGGLPGHVIANSLWCLARVQHRDPVVFRLLGDMAASEEVVWYLKPHEVSKMVWAFAAAALPHPRLFESLVPVIYCNRWELPPHSMASIASAYVAVDSAHSRQIVAALVEVAHASIHSFRVQELAILVSHSVSQACPGALTFLSAVASRFQGELHECSARDLVRFGEGFLGAMPNDAFVADILAECVSRIHTFRPRQLAALTRAASAQLAVCAWSSCRGQLEVFLEAASRTMEVNWPSMAQRSRVQSEWTNDADDDSVGFFLDSLELECPFKDMQAEERGEWDRSRANRKVGSPQQTMVSRAVQEPPAPQWASPARTVRAAPQPVRSLPEPAYISLRSEAICPAESYNSFQFKKLSSSSFQTDAPPSPTTSEPSTGSLEELPMGLLPPTPLGALCRGAIAPPPGLECVVNF